MKTHARICTEALVLESAGRRSGGTHCTLAAGHANELHRALFSQAAGDDRDVLFRSGDVYDVTTGQLKASRKAPPALPGACARSRRHRPSDRDQHGRHRPHRRSGRGAVLTPLMAQLLMWMRDDVAESVDAALYADALARLLDREWIRLEGTLEVATVVPTDAGLAALDRFLAEKAQ